MTGMHPKHKVIPVGFVLPKLGAGCGVFDYASRLANALELCTRHHDNKNSLGVRIEDLAAFKASLTTHSGDPLEVLHYSGYGYAKRGVPLHLVRLVAAWRRLHPAGRWVTMFHEVAASGPPTTSAFWLNPLQMWVAKRLLKLSDRAFTNCSMNAGLLNKAAPEKTAKLRIVPVFSNFGEPQGLIPIGKRSRWMVLFSSNLRSQHGDGHFWERLARCVSLWQIEKVIVIGREVDTPSTFPCLIRQAGFLANEEVSLLLTRCVFGYAFVGPELFGKSGVFAAFAAHGVAPLVPTHAAELPDGLVAGSHYVRTQVAGDGANLDQLQSELLAWYRPHDVAAAAQAYAEALWGE